MLSSYLPVSTSIKILVMSSSIISMFAVAVPMTALTGVSSSITMFSFGSSNSSSKITTVIALLVSPALNTRVPETGS